MAKFINIALEKDVPSLVNVDGLVRIYPGLEGRTGKDEACTLVFGFAIETGYHEREDTVMEEYSVEVYLPIKEIIRRMKEELLVV